MRPKEAGEMRLPLAVDNEGAGGAVVPGAVAFVKEGDKVADEEDGGREEADEGAFGGAQVADALAGTVDNNDAEEAHAGGSAQGGGFEGGAVDQVEGGDDGDDEVAGRVEGGLVFRDVGVGEIGLGVGPEGGEEVSRSRDDEADGHKVDEEGEDAFPGRGGGVFSHPGHGYRRRRETIPLAERVVRESQVAHR